MIEKLDIPLGYLPVPEGEPELSATVSCRAGQRDVSPVPCRNLAVIDHHEPATGEILPSPDRGAYRLRGLRLAGADAADASRISRGKWKIGLYRFSSVLTIHVGRGQRYNDGCAGTGNTHLGSMRPSGFITA